MFTTFKTGRGVLDISPHSGVLEKIKIYLDKLIKE